MKSHIHCHRRSRSEQLVHKVLQEAANAEQIVKKVLNTAWNVCHFSSLPRWMQDNDFLHMGHRPPLDSFKSCFLSIFRMHTETGNIWTHLLGCFLFMAMAANVFTTSTIELTDKIVYGVFF